MDRAIAFSSVRRLAVADVEFGRARAEIARTGRTDLLARVGLMRSRPASASLVFERCEKASRGSRPTPKPPERAYADYLAARVAPADIALCFRRPPRRGPGERRRRQCSRRREGHRGSAVGLAAIGVLFQAGRASPPAIAMAADTASSQGWRSPLLAWLSVQLALAEKAGNAQEAERLRRRVGVGSGRPVTALGDTGSGAPYRRDPSCQRPRQGRPGRRARRSTRDQPGEVGVGQSSDEAIAGAGGLRVGLALAYHLAEVLGPRSEPAANAQYSRGPGGACGS
ncbi:MAG: hypothetical protein IPI27_05645 [Betaproteobacteria bacterium]|nr:hypothetical protein [Betaproteobacteria bacterium]